MTQYSGKQLIARVPLQIITICNGVEKDISSYRVGEVVFDCYPEKLSPGWRYEVRGQMAEVTDPTQVADCTCGGRHSSFAFCKNHTSYAKTMAHFFSIH